MPVKYVEIMDSHGNPRGTDQIAHLNLERKKEKGETDGN